MVQRCYIVLPYWLLAGSNITAWRHGWTEVPWCVHRWARALKKYKKGVELIEHDDQFSPEEKKLSADIKKSCNLNLAATYLKVNDSKEARKACNKVSHTLSILTINKRHNKKTKIGHHPFGPAKYCGAAESQQNHKDQLVFDGKLLIHNGLTLLIHAMTGKPIDLSYVGM